MEPKSMAVRALTVRGPFRGSSGHDHHVREFVRGLAAMDVAVQLLDLPEWSPVKLSDGDRDPWFETLTAPVAAPVALHFCMPHQVKDVPGVLNVNYTMFEATRVPTAWRRANLRHDLVVVPTASPEAAWVERGYPRERIRICPLGVDPDQFHPGAAPLELVDQEGRPVREYRTRVLNVSELGLRKNLMGLLRAWIRATDRGDDAILILKLGGVLPAGVLRLLRDIDTLERQIGKTRRESAPVLFVDTVFPDELMPRLFAAATHYWSMSHGEGWDQPMVEAGATGLRLIAPMHTAYEAYLDSSVATMIPARLVPAQAEGGGSVGPLFEGSRWWEPDEDAAADAVRAAIRNDSARSAIRDRIAAALTWEHATSTLIAILEELHREHGHAWQPARPRAKR